MKNFLQSSAKDNFTAKLAPKWIGRYQVIQQTGPVNFQIVLESTGEDVHVVHVCNLKPCFPTATELAAQDRQKLIDLFQECSDEDEEFPGLDGSTSYKKLCDALSNGGGM